MWPSVAHEHGKLTVRSHCGAGPELWLMASPAHAVGEAESSVVDPGELAPETPSGALCGLTYCSHIARA